MKNKILIINAGSSSIKWQLLNKYDLTPIASGLAERIGVGGEQSMKWNNQSFDQEMVTATHKEAVSAILKMWSEQNVIADQAEITNVGFRIVHGGKHFTKPTMISKEDVEIISELSKFAPLHNPGAVQAIKAFEELFPQAKLSANFDTSFHASIPLVNSTYPINAKLSRELEIKKYGMHGISHRYITKKVETILGKSKVNFVNLHIGNGASLCAVKESQSFDTTMGLTPLAGIMMGTRSGDIDPSIHAYVCKEKNITIDEFTRILNKESGLQGVSEVSLDMRDVTKACQEGNKQAQLAFDLYVQRIVDYTAAFMNKVETPEAIVFTAGVGENSYLVREKVIENLKPMGLLIDKSLNQQTYDDYLEISAPDSKIKVFVTRTNEELMIAQDALELEKNML